MSVAGERVSGRCLYQRLADTTHSISYKDANMLTQAELKENLIYFPDDGIFMWKVSRRSAKANTIAGGGNKKGYIMIGLNQKQYFAHILAWLYVTGEYPKGDLDHIDGNKQNNSFSNLREATRSQNCMNRKKASNNTTGYKGVSFNK